MLKPLAFHTNGVRFSLEPAGKVEKHRQYRLVVKSDRPDCLISYIKDVIIREEDELSLCEFFKKCQSAANGVIPKLKGPSAYYPTAPHFSIEAIQYTKERWMIGIGYYTGFYELAHDRGIETKPTNGRDEAVFVRLGINIERQQIDEAVVAIESWMREG